MNGNCSKCGIYRTCLHKDHIVPKWSGGTDDASNIQLLCANCHEDKSYLETQSPEFREHERVASMLRSHTDEAKAKMRMAVLGRAHTDEEKARVRKTMCRIMQTSEARERMRQTTLNYCARQRSTTSLEKGRLK